MNTEGEIDLTPGWLSCALGDGTLLESSENMRLAAERVFFFFFLFCISPSFEFHVHQECCAVRNIRDSILKTACQSCEALLNHSAAQSVCHLIFACIWDELRFTFDPVTG